MCAESLRKDNHKDNHYVTKSYLKLWSADGEKIWTYRVLASHPNVQQWKLVSLKGIAYHTHLYARVFARWPFRRHRTLVRQRI